MGFNFKFFGSGGTFPHGVHPPERKAFAENAAIEVMPPPDKVVIPLLQNVGAPGKPSVKAKASVAMGDRIADAGGFVSAPIHSPIAGKVAKVGTTTLPNGRHVAAMPIKAEGEQLSGRDLWDEIFGGDWPREGLARYGDKEIVDAIQNAGVVGLGGATFPTHVKYVPNDKKPIDTVMINGCECEPYLTSDYRMMIEAPEPIIAGALLLGQVTHARDIIIGVEDNKPKAVEALQKAAAGTGIRIAVFKTKYPQGSEKQLILAATGRAVPLGGLPLDVGVAVSNVSTAAVVARAVLRGKPLTHRVVSVTGAGIRNPKNLLVPMGIAHGRADRLLWRADGGCGPDRGRRSHDGLRLFRHGNARDQGHQRHHRAHPRGPEAGGGNQLHPVRSLRGRLSDEPGSQQAGAGLPQERRRPGADVPASWPVSSAAPAPTSARPRFPSFNWFAPARPS